ncbi:MAG TPA: aldo/keto reductase [Acidobacteriota bacterium]|jgi:aryl-alcohol dehydrogenase-like predicted oxidoreductase
MQNRREFLIASGKGLLCASVAAKVEMDAAGDAFQWRNRQSGMAYRRLGRTGMMISEVVMGGNTIAPDNYDHVLLALDHGLNYLDTAPAYGQGKSEEGYSHVIRARGRDKFFLTSKISPWDINRNKLFQEIFASLPASEQTKLRNKALDEIARRKADDPDYFCNYFNGQRKELDDAALSNVMEKEYGRSIDREKNYNKIIVDSVDRSLSRLGTDHLDCMLCPHGANTPYELLNFPEIFEAFETLKKMGKVRYLGVSAHTDPGGILEAAVEAKLYSMAMVAFNVVNQSYVATALKRAKDNDLGVIAMKVARPVYPSPNRPADPRRAKLLDEAVSGSWKPPQKAYLWALRNPNLTAVISEMVNAEMVKDNLPLAGKS